MRGNVSLLKSQVVISSQLIDAISRVFWTRTAFGTRRALTRPQLPYGIRQSFSPAVGRLRLTTSRPRYARTRCGMGTRNALSSFLSNELGDCSSWLLSIDFVAR